MVSNSNLRIVLSLAWIAGLVAAEPSSVTINYADNNDPDFALKGYMTTPAGTEDGMLLPAVVILPDWDNVNDYEITRATMISEELGYIGFTADIYGADMHDIQDTDVKRAQATYYRSDWDLFNSRIQSAIDIVKVQPNVDPDKVAIIGYCLGGSGVIGYSFANIDPSESSITAAVSFHGGLMDFPVEGDMASPILILSGGDDDAGTAVEDLEAKLKEASATWQISRYSGVVHGFTKFGSDAYNAWVDDRSWSEMVSFLAESFGEVTYGTIEPTPGIDYSVIDGNGSPSVDDVSVQTIFYKDDTFELMGYIALPPGLGEGETRPALLILPDWDGVNGPTGYEAGRAVMAAREGGYVAMVADIYGTEYTTVEGDMRGELATFYRADPELFVKRIQAGIDRLTAESAVDPTRVFVAGYCFGGSGSVDYGFTDLGELLKNKLTKVRAVVPIHGGLNPLRALRTDVVEPYVLVLSGGVDDAHGNTTELELYLDGASAQWEISRYSQAQHGFTKWGPVPGSRYNAMADSRSWWSMMSLFDTLSEEYSPTVAPTVAPTKKVKKTKKTKKTKKPKKTKKTDQNNINQAAS